MGFWHPTTFAGSSSDLHQACLTWLCCAFRFSQPLDALFRCDPFRPCFMPVTPLGFRSQRFSLPGSGPAFRQNLPFLPNLPTVSATCQDGERVSHGFKDLRIRRVRSVRGGVIRDPPAVPLSAFTSTRCSPQRPWLRASTEPPLMGFCIALGHRPRSKPVTMHALQSFKEPMARLVSFETADLPEVLVLVTPRKRGVCRTLSGGAP